MKKLLENELYHNSIRIGKLVLYYPFGTKNSAIYYKDDIISEFKKVLSSLLTIILFPILIILDLVLIIISSIPKTHIIKDTKEFDKLKLEYRINSISDDMIETLKNRIDKGEI